MRYAAFWLIICAGCSSFDRDFRSAAADGSGRAYVGAWRSEQGHGSGQLKAIVDRQSGTCDVRFLAGYWGILRTRYDASFQITGQAIRGQQDLGWLAGGVYRYEGQLTPQRFTLRYVSDHDQGTFDLRPAPTEPP